MPERGVRCAYLYCSDPKKILTNFISRFVELKMNSLRLTARVVTSIVVC